MSTRFGAPCRSRFLAERERAAGGTRESVAAATTVCFRKSRRCMLTLGFAEARLRQGDYAPESECDWRNVRLIC